jgi:hypothetical protein
MFSSMFSSILNINTLIIIIIGYFLIEIIKHNFNNSLKHNLKDNKNNIEGFVDPIGFDKNELKYRDTLKTNINDVCERKGSEYCMPFENDKIPQKSSFKEPESGIDNLIGHNFLNAKYHSQVDNVGTKSTNKKVDIRPELINPQNGVLPTSQTIMNIDWNNDDKALLYQQKYLDIWDQLV